MPDITIGRLRGGFCVSWKDPNTGRRKRYQLEARSKQEAEAEAVEVYRLKQREGLSDVTSVDAIWAAYRNHMEGRTIAHNMQWSGKSILAFFGRLHPSQIHVETCRAYIARRDKDGVKSNTTHTELSHLRICLKWAEKEGLIDRAPHIQKPIKPMSRERWLTRQEVVDLIEGAREPHVRLALVLMITTAGRIGALLDLTWDRVDMERGQINLRIPDDFRRKGRAIVPINDMLRAELELAQAAALTDYVVERGGKRIKSIRKGFENAAKRAGIEGVTPHDLRRSAARFMAEAGRPMQEIAQYLGHSNVATTFEVYARFSPEHLQEAADVLDFSEHSKVHRTRRASLK